MMMLLCICLAGCNKRPVDYKSATKEELISLADNGDQEAMLQLGRNAVSKDHDLESAAKYFKMAADEENGTGLFNYFVIDSNLHPESYNKDKNKEILKKAYELGSPRAASQYGIILICQSQIGNRQIIDQNKFDEGMRICEETAEKYGDADAYHGIALGIGTIHGNSKSEETLQYLEKAIDAGSYEAFNLYTKILLSNISVEETIQKLSKWKEKFPLTYNWFKTSYETGNTQTPPNVEYEAFEKLIE